MTAYQIAELTTAKQALDTASTDTETAAAFDTFVAIVDDLRQNDPAAYIKAHSLGLTK